jgi:hypothetical protein
MIMEIPRIITVITCSIAHLRDARNPAIKSSKRATAKKIIAPLTLPGLDAESPVAASAAELVAPSFAPPRNLARTEAA